MSRNRNVKIFSGSSNAKLAQEVCKLMDLPLGNVRVRKFSDGELFLEVQEKVRNTDVFVIQSTSSPANEHIMELLILLDALKRASAASICVVMPYFGYARQDRKVAPRTPVAAKLVANLLQTAGATRALAVELHSGQIQGFFDIPFDHLHGLSVLIDHLKEHFPPKTTVLVSPDAGGVERTRAYAEKHGGSLAIVDRRDASPDDPTAMTVIGDVKNLDAVIIDDMVDSGGTLLWAADLLKQAGARRVFAYVTHPILSDQALDKIEASCIEKLIVTDTIALDPRALRSPKIEVISAAELLAKALRRIHSGDSLSSLLREAGESIGD